MITMSTELIAGLVGAGVGSGLSCLFTGYQTWKEQRARRRALSTAAMVELGRLFGVLTQFPEHLPTGPLPPVQLDSTVLDELSEFITLFGGRTLEALIHVRGNLPELRAGIETVRLSRDDQEFKRVVGLVRNTAALVGGTMLYLSQNGAEWPTMVQNVGPLEVAAFLSTTPSETGGTTA